MSPQVLIVDDQRVIRRVLQAYVDAHPHLMTCSEEAETGRQAVAVAERRRPDVVILDNEMPEMTGLEALPAIRNAVPEAVIVMYSSLTSPEVAEAALRLGATVYLAKGMYTPEKVVDLAAGLACPAR